MHASPAIRSSASAIIASRTGTRVEARLVVLADTDLDAFVRDPNLELIAYGGTVPFDERVEIGRRAAAEQQRLLAAYNSGTMTADAFAREFQDSIVRGTAVAVFRES